MSDAPAKAAGSAEFAAQHADRFGRIELILLDSSKEKLPRDRRRSLDLFSMSGQETRAIPESILTSPMRKSAHGSTVSDSGSMEQLCGCSVPCRIAEDMPSVVVDLRLLERSRPPFFVVSFGEDRILRGLVWLLT